MVIGSIVVAVCLLVLGWAKELVGHFVEAGDFRRSCTIFVAVLAIYAVDFAINAGELSMRLCAFLLLIFEQCKHVAEVSSLTPFLYRNSRQAVPGRVEWPLLGI